MIITKSNQLTVSFFLGVLFYPWQELSQNLGYIVVMLYLCNVHNENIRDPLNVRLRLWLWLFQKMEASSEHLFHIYTMNNGSLPVWLWHFQMHMLMQNDAMIHKGMKLCGFIYVVQVGCSDSEDVGVYFGWKWIT